MSALLAGEQYRKTTVVSAQLKSEHQCRMENENSTHPGRYSSDRAGERYRFAGSRILKISSDNFSLDRFARKEMSLSMSTLPFHIFGGFIIVSGPHIQVLVFVNSFAEDSDDILQESLGQLIINQFT